MTNQSKKHFSVKRMALNAVMVALYIVISTFFAINLGPLKITFEALPVILCAIAFGPVDAILVGFLGEFINQMLTFGFTPTTLLWVLPIVVRAAIIGLAVVLMKKKLGVEALSGAKNSVILVVVSVIAGIVHSSINTVAFYVDSTMFGYYSYALVFGSFWLRIIAGVISSVVMTVVVLPLITALKRAKIIS